jgi:hypothetical protein
MRNTPIGYISERWCVLLALCCFWPTLAAAEFNALVRAPPLRAQAI